jgi:hypothetical protein
MSDSDKVSLVDAFTDFTLENEVEKSRQQCTSQIKKNERIRIPTLSRLCEDKIMKSSLHDMMTTFAALKYTDLYHIKSRLHDYLKTRFSLLIVRYDKETLIDVFTEGEYTKMHDKMNERLQAEKLMKVRSSGNVLEAINANTIITSLSSTSTTTKSVHLTNSVDGYYPYEALLQGMIWPTDVDPSKREQYLSENEFHEIFHMSKNEFMSLRNHLQIRLKKEKLLF